MAGKTSWGHRGPGDTGSPGSQGRRGPLGGFGDLGELWGWRPGHPARSAEGAGNEEPPLGDYRRRPERGRGCRSVKRRRWSRRCQTQASARPRSLLPARPRLPVGSEPGGSLVRTTRGHLGPAWDHSGPPRTPGAPLPTPPPPRTPSAAGEAAGPARLGPSRKADAGLSAPWARPGRWGLGEGTRRGRGGPARKGGPGRSGAVETQTEFPRGTRRALRPLRGPCTGPSRQLTWRAGRWRERTCGEGVSSDSKF